MKSHPCLNHSLSNTDSLKKKKSGPQKRIVDDTSRRIGILLQELEKKELSNDVVKSLHTLTNGKYRKSGYTVC